MEELHFKRTEHPHFNPDIISLDFFFEWLKDELVSQLIGETSELCDVIEEIPSPLTAKKIARFLQTGLKD
jgi:hypothetical protein